MVRSDDLPMGADADDEEPDAEAPKPEADEVGEEFEEECCVCVAHVAVGHYFGDDGVAEVDEAGDGEAGGTYGDELDVVRQSCLEFGNKGVITIPGRAVSRGSFWVMRR